jgi:DNA-binding NarL/FixJ family response regulator
MTEAGAEQGAPEQGAPQPRVRVRVVIVDDHEVLASTLAMALGAEEGLDVVGTAGSLSSAQAVLHERRADVVLLDHRLPDGDGIAAIPRLQELAPDARIIVLTASTSDDLLLTALENGAAGFVSKTRGLDELKAAVHAVAAGESVVSPELLTRLIPRLTRREAREQVQLTERELEVLDLVAQGLSNAAIAQSLFVSVHTVRNHVANLSSKLGAHSKLEALTIALREGIITPR